MPLTLASLLSSKFFIPTFALFVLSVFPGCGVKGDPRPPQDSLLPSVESHYIKSPSKSTNEKEEVDSNKKKNKEKK
jgi:hypothetical protein